MTDLSFGEALTQKATRLERCIFRARETRATAKDFATDFDHQDAAVLNVLRACECTIDIANMVISQEGLPVAGSAADAFAALRDHAVIEAPDADALRRMVGFRNVAVHGYEKLDLNIVAAVIDRELDALARFAGNMLARYQN